VPELPDVEVFRRRVARSALQRPIERVTVSDELVLRGLGPRTLRRRLRGATLTATRRHGKNLFVATDAGVHLLLHFGMTGYVDPLGPDDAEPRHQRVRFDFRDGGRLAFVDQRRLGTVGLVEDVDSWVEQHALGPDALSMDLPTLRRILARWRGALVGVLMAQEAIAGVGNLYSDEILFHARLAPRRRADALTGAEAARLHRQLGRVLTRAIEAGAQPERMPRGWLIQERRDGAECPRGRGVVRRYRAGGRTGYWCPTCQDPDE
jgi:formamidopyrimidine-DNA glycosylase